MAGMATYVLFLVDTHQRRRHRRRRRRTLIFYSIDDEVQGSNSEEVKWTNDGGGGFVDYSEVENDSSDSFVKLSTKHIKKNQTRSSELLLMKTLKIEVKAASLTTVVSLKHLQWNNKMNLNNYGSLDYLH